MASDDRGLRWDLVLPAAATVVAIALLLLASTATTARSERRTLTLEGRMSREARTIEISLREADPPAAEAVLAQGLADSEGLLRGLALLDPAGTLQAGVGTLEGPGILEVDLFLGPAWRSGETGLPNGTGQRAGPGRGMRGGGPGMGHSGSPRGRRVLRLVPSPAALGPPWSELLLMPVVVLTAVALVALSLVGGRLLVRRQRETLAALERQRLEGLALAGAGLAHQLRTPLATIKGSCQLLLEQETGQSREKGTALDRILRQAERMEHLLGDLLDYARPTIAEARPVPLRELAPELTAISPRVRITGGTDLAVQADGEHLRQILVNLLDNALQASPAEAPVEIAARTLDDGVEITVGDRGPGPGDDPEQMFEPYVTGRAGGTGLGLPIARSLARANGGELTLTPRPGGGAVARLLLPRALDAPEGEARQIESRRSGPGTTGEGPGNGGTP